MLKTLIEGPLDASPRTQNYYIFVRALSSHYGIERKQREYSKYNSELF